MTKLPVFIANVQASKIEYPCEFHPALAACSYSFLPFLSVEL